MCSFALLVACGSLQNRLGGGEDKDRKAYDEAMADEHYSRAVNIAREKKLGKHAIRRAAYADMWKDAKKGIILSAHLMAQEVGLSVKERRIFGEKIFRFLTRSGRCEDAADAAYFFDLPGQRSVEAVQCEERKNGLVSALSLACFRHAPAFEIAERKRKFLRDIRKYIQRKAWKLSSAIRQCAYDKTEIALLFRMVMKYGSYKLGAVIARKAELSGLKIDVRAYHRGVFMAALAKGRFDYARRLLKESSFRATHTDVRHFVKESIRHLNCSKAAIVAYEHGLPESDVEGVFGHKKCVGSDLYGFAQAIPPKKNIDAFLYFHAALRHGKFSLAWDLAGRVGKKTLLSHGVEAHLVVLEAAYKAKAYVVLIEFSFGNTEMTVRFRNGVLERALKDHEEWFVATHAHSKAKISSTYLGHKWHSWIERSYLSALERGAIILASQIAKTYGLPKKREPRCRLAFELAMLAKKPKDARFILGVCGFKDADLHRRAAKLRFWQRQRAWRERRGKQKRRGKRRGSGKWTIKRE